jgi:hypothetical protein
VIHELESSPQLVDAHRAYLRSLAYPPPATVDTRCPRRVGIGRLLVRAGQWMQARRAAVAQETPRVTSHTLESCSRT